MEDRNKLKKKKLPIIIVVLVIIVAVIAGSVVFSSFRKEDIRKYIKQEIGNIQKIPHFFGDHRIVIFAPHCDDETLGPGGLIKEALERKINVKVVLITNGDGFAYSAKKELGHIILTPEEYIKYALIRQKETVNALKNLGLPSQDIIFLGYPDEGISEMWEANWNYDNLAISHFSGKDHSPYANSYKLNAPYCGLSVLDDIKKIMKEFKPTDIYLPHANDVHPDHWATNCFVLMALEDLTNETDFASKVNADTYLVHRGDWPFPRGKHLDLEIVPPKSLAYLNGKWERYDLLPETTVSKYDAILKYDSQIKVMKNYLISFARDNELFEPENPIELQKVNVGEMKIDGKTEDWKDKKAVILDPQGDTFTRKLIQSADLTGVYSCYDDKNIYLRVQVVKSPSSLVNYLVHIHSFGKKEDQENMRITLNLKPPKRIETKNIESKYIKEIKFITISNGLELSIPRGILKNPRKIFLGAETRFLFGKIDQTGYKILMLD